MNVWFGIWTKILRLHFIVCSSCQLIQEIFLLCLRPPDLVSCFSPDASLTPRNVLRAVQDVWMLGHVLEVPLQVGMKLQQEREGSVDYFLQTHPYASWEWLGGRFLFWEQDKSVQHVKSHIRLGEGMYAGMCIKNLEIGREVVPS